MAAKATVAAQFGFNAELLSDENNSMWSAVLYGIGTGDADHVGIVERVEGDRIYTVEGNSGDECRQNSYPIGYYQIYGYGITAY